MRSLRAIARRALSMPTSFTAARTGSGHSPFLSRPTEMAAILREEMANALA
ncbi:hypothetical protein [Pseudonocardia alaniniphila]|uniref:Alpha/beta hydrolase family protein n=1 Tax=Pseudonocardia alaniniphila TaxID=75291 RepID=A0ABS9THQ9_9PSEU|nr:hypothetical protein [Pseudonocardia alaniniphila]MCH6168064.1 hypothetical protein [Pseudonocardia alaniniphila]